MIEFQHTLSIITTSGAIKISVNTKEKDICPFQCLTDWFKDTSVNRTNEFAMEGYDTKVYLTRNNLNLFTIEVKEVI